MKCCRDDVLPGQTPTTQGSDEIETTFEETIDIYYMGVSVNGGTPKTPQNDHF